MHRFCKNIDGNVGVLFGLALLPLVTAIGMAVDYSRATSARTVMQTALDGAALMIAKDAAGLSAAEVTSRAQGYFNAYTDGDPASAILQYCASGSSNYFMVTSSTQIMSAFDTIGAQLSKLRIAK